MNVARMKRRAEEAIAGGEAPSYVLEQVARDVLALLAERERLDALLAALRSVDERELPEHVAAALRAANEGEQPPEKAVLSGEAEKAFIDHAREEGLAYAAENYEVNDPTLRRLVDAYNHAGRALGRALGL